MTSPWILYLCHLKNSTEIQNNWKKLCCISSERRNKNRNPPGKIIYFLNETNPKIGYPSLFRSPRDSPSRKRLKTCLTLPLGFTTLVHLWSMLTSKFEAWAQNIYLVDKTKTKTKILLFNFCFFKLQIWFVITDGQTSGKSEGPSSKHF